MASEEIISYEPATGAELWRGRTGDFDEIVARARRAWAAQPLSTQMELVRRIANEVRKDAEKLADLMIWAFAERTGQRKLDPALQGTAALRHKPHGVMVVLGPLQVPRAPFPTGTWFPR